MNRALVGASLALACASPVLGDQPAEVSVSVQDVIAKRLLPIGPQSGIGVPAFKFFDHNKLVGLLSGAPTENKPLKNALHTLPAAFTNSALKDEIKWLHFTAAPGKRIVLIYTMNANCPPCDGIIEKVKNQLPGLGWGQAQILIANIAMPAPH